MTPTSDPRFAYALLVHASLTTSLLLLNPLGISGARLQVFSFTFAAAVWLVIALTAGAERVRRGLARARHPTVSA